MLVARRFLQGSLLIVMLLALPLNAGASSLSFPWPPVDLPTGSELRAGPLGLNPVSTDTRAAQLPVAINIPDAAVNAEVEQNQIVDGTMLDPSGPWVVSWYEETAQLGEHGNSVMAGHLDYWDVGPAVFYDLPDLSEGASIQVMGESRDIFIYEVTWARLYQLEELNSQVINDIVGPTTATSLTLITCGGAFDEATGQYLSRYVVRAELTTSTQVTRFLDA